MTNTSACACPRSLTRVAIRGYPCRVFAPHGSGDNPMPSLLTRRSSLALAAALLAIIPAAAQQPRPNQLPPPGPPQAQPQRPGGPQAPAQAPAPQMPAQAPIKPYQPVAVAPPKPATDASFDA